MKLLLALFLLLSLTACTAEADLTYDQEHIDVTLEPDALYTAMTERDVIGVRKTGGKYSSFLAPIMYQSEKKGYLLHNVPEDIILTGDTAADEYINGSKALNRLEVYSTPECSGEPEKVIHLTALEPKVLFQWL